MKAVTNLFLVATLCAAAGCTKTYEPSSRRTQERMFHEFFGFAPPAEVSEIRYREVANRHLMNGAWGRWMSFTYSPEVFSNIVQQSGFKLKQSDAVPTAGADPVWWPDLNPSNTIYTRDQEHTPQHEGFIFREYIWSDTNSNLIFYHKFYSG